MVGNRLNDRQRLIRFAVLLLCTATLLMTCLQVIGQGFSPLDDALRHVAKVESGKEWHDILVIRDEIRMDSHPGWHTLLGLFYRATGADRVVLLNFSVVFLFLAFTIPPAFFFRRPQAWMISLILSALFCMGAVYRLFYGRPFILSMVLVLLFCFSWKRVQEKQRPYGELALFTSLAALSTWIHGTWYLLALPLAALLLARRRRAFFLMGIGTVAGIVLGALLTGRPALFLHQTLFHAVNAFGNHDFQRQLVTEFQVFDGAPGIVVVIGILILGMKARGDWRRDSIDHPVFILGTMGWCLGFVATRFWTDWGWPAISFWVAMEVQRFLESDAEPFRLKELALTAFVCLVLFLSVSGDRGNRWSIGAEGRWPDMSNAAHRPFLPGEGGVLYSDQMNVFYHLFFHNPHGPWRYVLGFEPIWMPKEDLEIYRRIQLTRGEEGSYTPWVQKMTEKDRMVLVRGERPRIDGLVWHQVTKGVWAGSRPAKD
jgi:hypothetical protein